MGLFSNSKSSTTNNDYQIDNKTAAQDNGIALNLAGSSGSSVVMSDYGAIGAALGMTEKSLSTASSLASDGISASSKSLNDSANLIYDGVSKTLGVVQDVINLGGSQNLEFLGKIENFSELAANHWLESAKLSDAQARYAMDYSAKENDANRVMLSDANRAVGDAYMNASQGLLAIADVSLDRFATMQNEATNAISKYAESAQGASMKALDMVFQSTKSPDERVIGDTTKWLVGGIVAAIALVFVLPKMGAA